MKKQKWIRKGLAMLLSLAMVAGLVFEDDYRNNKTEPSLWSDCNYVPLLRQGKDLLIIERPKMRFGVSGSVGQSCD